MKPLLLLLVVALLAGLVYRMMYHEAGVTEAAEYAFRKMHPGVTDCEWKREYETFEAEMENGKSAFIYDEKGQFLFRENERMLHDLPAGCAEYLDKNFSGAAINEISEITDAANNKTFEVEVMNRDLIFDFQGKYIGEEEDYSESLSMNAYESAVGINLLPADGK